MKCPVCKTEYSSNAACSVCGFSETGKVFINQEEAEHWMNTTVHEYRLRWMSSLKEFVFDKTYTTLIKYNGTANSVSVPYGIRRIGAAFYKNICVQTVTLPDTIEEIQDNAFNSCKNMTTINLPNSLRVIGKKAFAYCNKLDVYIPESVFEIGEAAFPHTRSIKVSAHNRRFKMESGLLIDTVSKVLLAVSFPHPMMNVVVPSDVLRIGEQALFTLYRLPNKIILQKGLQSLASLSCVGDTTGIVTVPNTVTKIEDEAFPSRYKDIILEDGNLFYVKRKNAIIEKESRKLISICDKSCNTVQISPAVRRISPRAFSYCENLESFVVPKHIEEIGLCAFMNCSKLKYIVIPKSVDSIGFDAFHGCESLKAIYCEHKDKPTGWHSDWLGDEKLKVYWAGEWEYVPQPVNNKQLTLWESDE